MTDPTPAKQCARCLKSKPETDFGLQELEVPTERRLRDVCKPCFENLTTRWKERAARSHKRSK